MRKLFIIPLLGFFIISCNNKADETTASTSDSTSTTTTASSDDLVYPYTLEEPYRDWQPGDKKHAVTVMNGLKGFETGDMDATMAAFGDTVRIQFDALDMKVSRDSLRKFFTTERAKFSNITIKMGDWESVISKDKKHEYVTLWYKQIFTDKNGKTDSISVINDARIENGKIVELDEKSRRYAVKK